LSISIIGVVMVKLVVPLLAAGRHWRLSMNTHNSLGQCLAEVDVELAVGFLAVMARA
jgi:hypothetical protein